MCNLKKEYKWSYLQNRNRVVDVENKFMIKRSKGGGGGELGDLGLTGSSVHEIL